MLPIDDNTSAEKLLLWLHSVLCTHRRFFSYVSATILGTALALVGGTPARLMAQAMYCSATGIALGTGGLTGSATPDPAPATTWTFNGQHTLTYSCLTASFGTCAVCTYSETWYYSTFWGAWYKSASSTPLMPSNGGCSAGPVTIGVTSTFLTGGTEWSNKTYWSSFNQSSCGTTYKGNTSLI